MASVILFFSAVSVLGSEGRSSAVYIYLFVIWFMVLNATFFLLVKKMSRKLRYSNSDCSECLVALIAAAFSNIFIFADLYGLIGINTAEGTTRDAVDCIYFSIVTWTTLGYGDFSPTESLRIPAAIQALLGQLYMAILIGLSLSFFTRREDITLDDL